MPLIPFFILLVLMLSASLHAKEADGCSFLLDYKEDLDSALACSVDPTDFKAAKTDKNGLRKIVSQLHLYPVYSKLGELERFVAVDGKFQKGRVLVAKDAKQAIRENYLDFREFEIYESNHYGADLACFVGHLEAGIPAEKEVLKCVDEHIALALRKYKINEIKRFSIEKMKMVYFESTATFDTLSSCGGGLGLTFFQGKVYNTKDFGNFIWGAITQKLKVSDFSKKIGSELNAYLNSGKQNDGTFFEKTSILGDSSRDQAAIFDGARWMRRTHHD